MKNLNARVNNEYFQEMRLTIILFFICTYAVTAQSPQKLIRDGNKLYEQKKYSEAEAGYKKSIETKKAPVQGNYNLGNAYYKQGKFEEAMQQYGTVSSMPGVNKSDLAKTYHNLGNSLLKENKFQESIQAYKNSLKLNPKDNDTRYNLAYAQAKLQQQQQQQQDQNKDQKKDQEKDQEKKDQEDQKQQQDQKKEEQKQEEQQQEQKQARKDKISKEDAEKILQALNNDEKKTQKKLNQKEAFRATTEKEW